MFQSCATCKNEEICKHKEAKLKLSVQLSGIDYDDELFTVCLSCKYFEHHKTNNVIFR